MSSFVCFSICENYCTLSEKQMIIDIFSDEERVKDIIGRCKQTIDAVLSKSEFKHENWKYIAPTTSFENAVIEEVVKELKG